jgi:hypothetical protein
MTSIKNWSLVYTGCCKPAIFYCIICSVSKRTSTHIQTCSIPDYTSPFRWSYCLCTRNGPGLCHQTIKALFRDQAWVLPSPQAQHRHRHRHSQLLLHLPRLCRQLIHQRFLVRGMQIQCLYLLLSDFFISLARKVFYKTYHHVHAK